jgi:serine/threonine protein kinase
MTSQANQPLAAGTQLQNYRILRVLAAGGFSFVYLAHDANEQPVAIKEYLPSTLALRAKGAGQAQLAAQLPSEHLALFRVGMKCFFEEAGALARLSHPNVIRVLDIFRANETVYLVMRYERGRALNEHLRALSEPVSELWMRNTFAQLLDGLREVHTAKLLHLDIKPANVYLRNDGTPLLIDFGAARQVLSAEGMKLPPLYTPGFAAPEMHDQRDQLGPWSDIYSIGATMYACLSRATPQAANARRQADAVAPAKKAWAGKYAADLLEIIDWSMQLDHLKRPQSVRALQKALLGEAPNRRTG